LPAFRAGDRKFASLASPAGGYGNLMLTLKQQATFVEETPEIFAPIPGGWGKMGHTHIRLAASEDVLTGVHSERRGNCELVRTQRQAVRTM
jgi:hypothetical protein